MPGARCTRGLVCKQCAKNAHEHTGTVGTLRHSLRNGLTAYAALSLETNSSCLHRCRLDGSIDPVGSKSPPAAWHQPRVSGPHGFAVRVKRRSFCAMCAAHEVQLTLRPPSAPAPSRPPHPVPRSGRRAIRPSCRVGIARKKPLIWVGWKAEYFCAGDWMTQISLKLFNKLPFARNDIGNLRGAGRARCMHVRISDDLS